MFFFRIQLTFLYPPGTNLPDLQLLRDRHVDLRLPLGDLDLDHRVLVDRFRFLDRHFCLG